MVEYLVVLYGSRCARCGDKTTQIHEIVPRSEIPNDWFDASNMILLCAQCHTWVHEIGPENAAIELSELQARAMRGRMK